MIKPLASTLFCFILSISIAGADGNTYLCIAEHSVGFKYEDGSWHESRFDVSDEKFLIKKLETGKYYDPYYKGYKYGIFPLGETNPTHRCEKRQFNAVTGFSYICGTGHEIEIFETILGFQIGHIYFSPESGKFVETYNYGYWPEDESSENTPYITLGRCSVI